MATGGQARGQGECVSCPIQTDCVMNHTLFLRESQITPEEEEGFGIGLALDTITNH